MYRVPMYKKILFPNYKESLIKWEEEHFVESQLVTQYTTLKFLMNAVLNNQTKKKNLKNIPLAYWMNSSDSFSTDR